jgi:hypothetical protein
MRTLRVKIIGRGTPLLVSIRGIRTRYLLVRTADRLPDELDVNGRVPISKAAQEYCLWNQEDC